MGPLLRSAALVLLAGLVGCATFSELPPLPPRQDATPQGSVRVDVAERAFRTRADRSWAPSSADLPGEQVLVALRESGWFDPVGADLPDPDFTLSVTVRRDQDRLRGSLLSLATAFLIPSTSDRSLAVAMTLRRDGEPARACAVQRPYRIWHQLFLAPFWLSRGPANYEPELVRRLARLCLQELLSAPSPAP